MAETEWTNPRNRFVAFFDIMGFKEMVERNDHSYVVGKLNLIKTTLKNTEGFLDKVKYSEFQEHISETKAVTFSDSIIIFSKEDSIKDLCKILWDSAYIIHHSLKNNIGIKGAISFGEITVDFKNSLFFGRPIIDAFLLHDQIQLYTAIIDNNVERIINDHKIPSPFNYLFTPYKAKLKNGKVNHLLIRPPVTSIAKQIQFTKEIYNTVSGSPRIYVDNTLDFLTSLLKPIRKKRTPKAS